MTDFFLFSYLFFKTDPMLEDEEALINCDNAVMKTTYYLKNKMGDYLKQIILKMT